VKRRAFTLLELVFVIAIIAVLAAILFPMFARARERARRSSCASNLFQIGTALTLYAQDNDGRFPPDDNECGPIYRYLYDVSIFLCPSDPANVDWKFAPAEEDGSSGALAEPLTPIETYSSYVYKGGLTNEHRADTLIAGEAELFHRDAANVLYIGGHVKSIPAEIYEPVVEPTKEPVQLEPEPESGPLGPPVGGG